MPRTTVDVPKAIKGSLEELASISKSNRLELTKVFEKFQNEKLFKNFSYGLRDWRNDFFIRLAGLGHQCRPREKVSHDVHKGASASACRNQGVR